MRLAPGESTTVEVGFTPTAAAAFDDASVEVLADPRNTWLASLQSRFPDLVDDLDAASVDWRVGVTSHTATTACNGLTRGWIDASTAAPGTTFAAWTSASAGTCAAEEGFTSAMAALQSPSGEAFLRDDSMLVVVFVTDEDEQSARTYAGSGGPWAFVQDLVTLVDGDATRVSVHTLAGPSSTGLQPCGGGSAQGTARYLAPTTYGDGIYNALCRDETQAFLTSSVARAAAPLARFRLSRMPQSLNAVTVTLEGATIPHNGATGWSGTVDPPSIRFATSVVLGDGDEVVLTYAYDTVCPD